MLYAVVQWNPLHNWQTVLMESLDALAVYRPHLLKTEDIIYRCLYADGYLSSFQSTRSIFASC